MSIQLIWGSQFGAWYQGWYPKFLLKIDLEFLLRKIGARLHLKIDSRFASRYIVWALSRPTYEIRTVTIYVLAIFSIILAVLCDNKRFIG